MAFICADTDAVWIKGAEVEFYKSAMRQADTDACMRILQKLLGPGGGLERTVIRAQAIIDNARLSLNGGAPTLPNLPDGTTLLWTQLAASQVPLAGIITELAKVQLLDGNGRLVNPLAFGDFLRYFADLFNEYRPQPPADGGAVSAQDQYMIDYAAIFSSIRNPEAFSKTTNRVRVNRKDVLNQMPNVGGAQFYLPSEDVLGAIDRLLGFYETADISGTTTDGLVVLALLGGAVSGAADQLNLPVPSDTRADLPKFINSGVLFGAFAGMVVQGHHSLPEVMMAINLIPRASFTGAKEDVSVIYSPFITNDPTQFPAIQQEYSNWQRARRSVLGDETFASKPPVPDGTPYGFFLNVFQDVYQMPNRPSEVAEIGIIQRFTYTVSACQNDANVFGVGFYNAIVPALNAAHAGPAITLAQLGSAALPISLVGGGVYNPQIQTQAEWNDLSQKSQRAMQLPRDYYANATAPYSYAALASPFAPVPTYSEVERAQV